jgi:hypothetical protein
VHLPFASKIQEETSNNTVCGTNKGTKAQGITLNIKERTIIF